MVFSAAPDATERRYKKEPFTRRELTTLLEGMTDWREAINTRHKVVKEKGWGEKPPSLATFVKAAVAEPNLLRRPLIRRGSRVLYSRDASEIRAFLR